MKMQYILYVGTYTNGKSKGIYQFRFDTATETAREISCAENNFNPSFLTFSRDGTFLYTADELPDTAQVSAYAVDETTGALTYVNTMQYPGNGCCHVQTSSQGYIIGANYNSGDIFSAAVRENGGAGALVSHISHKGHSVNPNRQEGPHAHCVIFDHAEQFAFCANLGTDTVYGYRFDPNTGALTPHNETSVEKGQGPRHLIFNWENDRAYLLTELGNMVISFEYDKETGVLRQAQTMSSLPEGFFEESDGADIHLSPDQRFLYASNRGHDSIACFDIANGAMKWAGFIKSGGKTPRNFAISPCGSYLFVANQDSDTIAVIRRNRHTGLSDGLACTISALSPVCVLIR